MDLANVLNGLDIAITITDKEGNFIFLNDKSGAINANGDARALIGKQVRHYHNERSKAIIERLFQGEKNIYTITKKGQRKLIYQTPWLVDGEVKGLVELSMVIPESMPHYNRDAENPPAESK